MPSTQPRPRREPPPRADSGQCTTCYSSISRRSTIGTWSDMRRPVGLDATTFERDLHAHAHKARVREDFMSGVRSGVNGTPTFFINGVRFDDSWDAKRADALTVAWSAQHSVDG